MKIVINTFGTRGDVQPYVALGLGLKQAGHEVRLVSHQIFEDFIRQYGLDFHPMQANPREVLVSQAIAELGNDMGKIRRWMEGHFKTALKTLFEETLAGDQGMDLILNTGLSFAGWHVAEKLKIPAFAAYLWPANPSRYIPPTSGIILPDWMPFKGVSNYLQVKFSNQLFFSMLWKPANEYRETLLGLPSLSARYYWHLDSPKKTVPIIYGYSPTVLPKPKDWCEKQQISGYWFLDSPADYSPDPALAAFLAAGPPPVYIGFGSMVEHEREDMTKLVTEALQAAGQRGILLGGWSELGGEDLPDFILQVDSVPHDWLFPQMAAVVHHGGAGTTAAGLRAGVPSVLVPNFADQFFWGWRVESLGVGPKALPRKKLTASDFAFAIRKAVQDEEMRRQAKLLGEKIRAEDGVGLAVKMIEDTARKMV